MISSFGKFAKGLGAKIILTLLGLSMIVFWGLGGLTNLSLSRNTPAIEVGDDNISMQQLAQAFDKERERMGAMMGGQYLSPADGIKAGLLASAVQGQIIASVSKQVRDELGLNASDAAVRKYVERNPAFADALGNFDKNMFYAYLGQMRMSETELAHKLRDELAMQHLNNTIIELGYNPTILAEQIYKYKNEKRSVEAALIEPSHIKIEKKPTQEELKEYYEAYPENFILPEYRTVSIVQITPADAAKTVQIDTEKIDEVYQQKKSEFGMPEKRQLEQILFDSAEKATAVKADLTPDSFRKVATQSAGQTDEQTDFGWVASTDMLAELSEPVFKGKKGDIIGPVQTSLGWHFVLIRDIQPAVQPDEQSIKADIKKQLIQESAYGEMENIVRTFEDALGTGATLQEATKTAGLTVKKIGTFDATGTMQDGNSIDDDFKTPTLLQEIFTLAQGEPSAVMEHNNGYIVVQVDDIIPSAPKNFEDATEQLMALWTAEQQKSALSDYADTILKHTQKGHGLQAQGTFKNFTVFKETDITRENIGELPNGVINDIFVQKAGAENAVLMPLGDNIIISVVQKITPANPQKDERGVNIVKQTLKAQTGEGLANEVMGAYAGELGVVVNEKAIADAFAPYQTQE